MGHHSSLMSSFNILLKLAKIGCTLKFYYLITLYFRYLASDVTLNNKHTEFYWKTLLQFLLSLLRWMSGKLWKLPELVASAGPWVLFQIN